MTVLVVNCGKPDTRVYGNYKLVGDTTFGSIVRFRCNTGFRLEDQTTQCQANGTWSPKASTCISLAGGKASNSVSWLFLMNFKSSLFLVQAL